MSPKRECHGLSKTKLYKRWSAMRDRCNNPDSNQYADYGGRGITYDPRWDSFTTFYAEMGDGYREGLTIDRIDNNKGYSRENCRWAPYSEQLRNTRRNIHLTLGGETMVRGDWAKRLGMSDQALTKRLKRWPLEVALTKEPKRYNFKRYGN